MSKEKLSRFWVRYRCVVSIGGIIGVFQLCLILVRYVPHRSLPRTTSESIAQAPGRGKSGVSGRFFRGETGLRTHYHRSRRRDHAAPTVYRCSVGCGMRSCRRSVGRVTDQHDFKAGRGRRAGRCREAQTTPGAQGQVNSLIQPASAPLRHATTTIPSEISATFPSGRAEVTILDFAN